MGKRIKNILRNHAQSFGMFKELPFLARIGLGYATKFFVVFWAKWRQDVANYLSELTTRS